MMKLMLKAVMLLVLVAILIILLFKFLSGTGKSTSDVTITEKYYSPQSNGQVTGIKSNEVISVNQSVKGEVCAMKFSNDKVLTLECDRYLDYEIGDKVKITYKDDRVKEIKSVE
jgi:hypothetical protein